MFKRCYWTLIRLLWYDLNSLTFTLSAAASRSLVSGHAQCHQNKFASFAPPGLQSETCLKEPAQDDISRGLRYCCSFRPNTNSTELQEVSEHAHVHTSNTLTGGDPLAY